MGCVLLPHATHSARINKGQAGRLSCFTMDATIKIALVGTGMFGADASVSPLVPWKYCRLVVTAISGTGAQVAGFQNLGGV